MRKQTIIQRPASSRVYTAQTDRVTQGRRTWAARVERAKLPRTKITADQMRIILTAVEHGFREAERGKNLQGALASVHEMYEVAT